MRLVHVTCILAVALGMGTAGRAVAQGGAPGLRDSAPPVAAPLDTASMKPYPLPPWIRNRPAQDTLAIGPRLPALVRPITAPGAADQPLAPAPSGNIVIPVTTALIVLAALVVILLID